MVAHTARRLLSRATWTDFTYLLGGDGQEYHRSHRARGAEVDEAMLQCAGFVPRPASGTVRTSLSWRLETFAGRPSGMRAQHAIWPWTVATTVNRVRCLDIVGTRLRRAC